MFYVVKPSIPEGLWFYYVKPKSSMLLKSSILTSLKAHRENPRAARTRNKANNYHACAKRTNVTRKVTMVPYAQLKGAYCSFQIEDFLVKIFDFKKQYAPF